MKSRVSRLLAPRPSATQEADDKAKEKTEKIRQSKQVNKAKRVVMLMMMNVLMRFIGGILGTSCGKAEQLSLIVDNNSREIISSYELLIVRQP